MDVQCVCTQAEVRPLTRHELEELGWYERCSLRELATFSKEALNHYKRLMLKYATASVGERSVPGSPLQVA